MAIPFIRLLNGRLKSQNILVGDLDGLPVTVGQGGTGRASVTLGNLLLGNDTSALTLLAPGAAGNFVRSTGSAWAAAVIGKTDLPAAIAYEDEANIFTLDQIIRKATGSAKLTVDADAGVAAHGILELISGAKVWTLHSQESNAQLLIREDGVDRVVFTGATLVDIITSDLAVGGATTAKARIISSATLPYSFTGDTDTGFRRTVNADEVAIRTGGVDRLTIGNAAAAFSTTLAWGGGAAIASSNDVVATSVINTFTALQIFAASVEGANIIRVQGPAADGADTLKNSASVIWRGAYWDGALSNAVNATVFHRILSTTPTSEVVVTVGASGEWTLGSNNVTRIPGALNFGATTVINSSRNLVGLNAVAQVLTPDTAHSQDLGTLALPWDDIFSRRFICTDWLAGEAITAGDCVFLHNNGSGAPRWKLADADLAAFTGVLVPTVGIAQNTAALDGALAVVVAGRVSADKGAETWANGDVGKPVYVDTVASEVTITAPTAAGSIVFKVGTVATTAGEIMVQPQYIAENA